MSKKILFIYGQDFKAKSIQVLRKTPEAFARRGFSVDIIVARDNSQKGSYFYDDELDPDNCHVTRIYWPFPQLRGRIHIRFLRTILNKLAGFYVMAKLLVMAVKSLRANNYDVIYGFEVHGVIPAFFANKIAGYKSVLVTRFMGTWLTKYAKEKKYSKLVSNLDFIAALKINSDICIMTNDGTEGNYSYRRWGGNARVFEFLMNGVDSVSHICVPSQRNSFISVSRLNHWKRVDRVISVFSEYVKLDSNARLTIVGDGPEKYNLEKFAVKLGVEDKINFLGAINNKEVAKYLSKSEVFLSFYELSNLGNPLLEAIRSNKMICTLNNGSTGTLITHKHNGLIYDELQFDPVLIAKDIFEVFAENLLLSYKENLKLTESALLRTWDERLDYEVDLVEHAIK